MLREANASLADDHRLFENSLRELQSQAPHHPFIYGEFGRRVHFHRNLRDRLAMDNDIYHRLSKHGPQFQIVSSDSCHSTGFDGLVRKGKHGNSQSD